MRITITLLALAACNDFEAPAATTPTVAVRPFDAATFAATLRRDDWATLIDARSGFVALSGDPPAGQRTVRRWCGRAAVHWSRFYALSTAAEMISTQETARCGEVALNVAECTYEGSHVTKFRFAHGDKLLLLGLADYLAGTVTAQDRQEWEAAMTHPIPCGET